MAFLGLRGAFQAGFPRKGRMHFGEFNLRDTIFARTKEFDLDCSAPAGRPLRLLTD